MTSGGCGCGCPGGSPCRCDPMPVRWPVSNPGGLRRIAYRTGDFSSFRHALLRHLDGETELDIWQPTAGSDLGLQVLDWWAYIADVLTFYNEQIANEDYLGTATLDTSVRRLADLLGYRPRPGIGATARLAVIASGPGPLIIPAGLAIASKAAPGVDSQTFETITASPFPQPTSVPGPAPDNLAGVPPAAGPPSSAAPGAAEPPAHSQLIARGGVLVKGTPTSIAAGDRLLLIAAAWQQPGDPAAVVTVTGLVTEKDPHGRKNTRVLLTGASSLGSGAAKDFRLVRATRTSHPSTLPACASAISGQTIVLDSTARYLHAGDPLLLELPGAGTGTGESPGSGFALVALTSYAEVLWYANADPLPPTKPPADGTPGIALLLASLTVAAHSGTDLPGTYAPDQTTVRAGWSDVGVLLDIPTGTLSALPGTLTLAQPPAAPAGTATLAIIEDANGNGTTVAATPAAGSGEVTIAAAGPDQPAGTLQAPLRILWDLVTVSRGTSVRGEVLGAGDAQRASQDFTLAKAPVTYLSDTPGRSGDGYSSTVTLAVAGRYWSEVPALYGHRPDEAIFVTYQDDDGKTHVRFGDGETGARLPSGATVTAGYRVGSGAAVPAAGTLSQVLTAVPNLRAVSNPVPPAGGADPDPPETLRRLAPRTVLTFGRAISGDDYAAVAAAAPGVTRAAATWAWDPAEQRPTVRVHVGDDPGAVASARTALRAQADPNRPLTVVPAIPCPTVLRIALELDPAYVPADVLTKVRSALLDPPGGLFAPGVLGLGQALYRSRIESAACAVPGVIATHDLLIRWQRPDGDQTSSGARYSPGDGGFFDLSADGLLLAPEADPSE